MPVGDMKKNDECEATRIVVATQWWTSINGIGTNLEGVHSRGNCTGKNRCKSRGKQSTCYTADSCGSSHVILPGSARPMPGRKFRKFKTVIGRRWPIGKFVKCRSNQVWKLWGASTSEQMVVECCWGANDMTLKNPCAIDWMNQRTNELMSQWTNESKNQWIDLGTKQWSNESIVSGSRHQWISMNQWSKEAMNQCSNEWMK